MNLENIAKKTDIKVVYDIGAYNGDFTRKNKKAFGKEVLFCMFEGNPHKKSPSWVGKNQTWNNVLLSKDDGQLIEFFTRNGTGDSYYKETDMTGAYVGSGYQTLLLSTKRLDTYIQERNIPLPDLIKIDTQGAELDILRGCDNILRNCKIIHCEVPAKGIEYNQGAPKHEEYFEFFESHGYHHKVKEKDHYSKGTLVQHDYIFMKEKFE